MLRFTPKDPDWIEAAHEEASASGMIEGTQVATAIGWRPVEAVAPGDAVLTFDEGLKPVTRVTRSVLWPDPDTCPAHLRPLRVPGGALGNQSEMLLLPEQLVLFESDVAEEIFGDPFTLLPAQALEGLRGIARVKPVDRVEVVSLCFEQDQVVFANIGALFYCPRLLCGESRAGILDEAHGPYIPLTCEQADMLTTIIEADEACARVH